MQSNPYDFYRSVVFGNVYKFLSCIDKAEVSPTRGCADRHFWKYVLLRRFASASYQQPIVSLALLYKTNFPDNKLYNSKCVLNIIIDLFHYWMSIQHKDGSFDEWFKGERSFCTSSFTSWAVAESLYLIKDDYALSSREEEALKRAQSYLSRNHNPLAANQMLASSLALYYLGRIVADSKGAGEFDERLNETLSMQSPEGWFNEYGGPDLGYSFLHLDFLCDLQKVCGLSTLTGSIDRLLSFMACVLGPHGEVCGELSSRETAHVLPYGLEYLSRIHPVAWQIRRNIFEGYERGVLLRPEYLDDKYIFYFYLNSFTKALIECLRGDKSKDTGFDPPRNTHFREAGLFCIHEKENSYFFHYGKGGIVRVYGDFETYVDKGYLLKIDNTVYVSGANNAFVSNGEIYSSVSQFYRICRIPRFPFAIDICIRSVIAAIPFINRFLKKIFFKMNLAHRTIPVYLHRDVSFKREEVIIRDTIRCEDAVLRKRIDLFSENKFQEALVSMSSGFFSSDWLKPTAVSANMEGRLIEVLKEKGSVTLVKKIILANTVSVEVNIDEGTCSYTTE